MFGSSNNQNQSNQDNQQQNAANGGLNPPVNDPANPFPEPTASPLGDATSAPHVDSSATDLGTPPLGEVPTSLPTAQAPAPPDLSSVNAPTVGNDDNNAGSAPAAISDIDNGDNSGNNDLIAIKQQALSQLSPLVSHLDQSPEDKFKTLMMMIQANDNQDLIKDAYEAAQQIPDEKTKSQALLDIVNEINYFTQNK